MRGGFRGLNEGARESSDGKVPQGGEVAEGERPVRGGDAPRFTVPTDTGLHRGGRENERQVQSGRLGRAEWSAAHVLTYLTALRVHISHTLVTCSHISQHYVFTCLTR